MKFITTLILALVTIAVFSQNQNEKLKEAIRSNSDWEVQSKLYDSLAAQAYEIGTNEYVLELKWIVNSVKDRNQVDAAAEYTRELAEAHYYNNLSLDSALRYLDNALKWDGLTEPKRGDVLATKAEGHFYQDQQDSAFHYYLLSATTFEQHADSTQQNFGRSFLQSAGVAMSLGRFSEASQLLDKARLILEYQKDSTYLLYSLNDKANLFSMNGFLERASQQREELIEIADSSTNRDLVVVTYMNYSNEARKLGKDSLELALIEKSLTLLDSTSSNSINFHYVGLCKLINAYARRNQPSKAIQYFEQMEFFEPQLRGQDWLTEYFLRAKVDALYSQGQLQQAIRLAKQIKESALERNEVETVMDMDRALHRIYLADSDYRNAHDSFVQYSAIKDSLSTVEKTNALLYLETQYEDERKKRIISNQENEIALLANTSEFQTKLIWIVALGLLSLFGAIYLYRSRKFAFQSKEMQEDFSRQLLSSHEDERKRISMDLHDSVGQSLMLIKNKIVLDQDEETVSMVSQALEEVRTISKALHPVLLEKLGLTASIQKLISDFDENTDILFSEEIESIDNIFSKDQELQLFRFLQESVNNVVKHAKTPSALIKVTNESGKVSLLVQDFGVGFDLTDQDRSVKSLGMKTLKERTQILGGKMIIDSIKNQGTSILLEISKPGKHEKV